MKKIESHADIEKKEKRRRLALSIFFIALLLLSTAGFALTSVYNPNSNTEQGVSGGQYNGQYWVYNLGGQEYYLSNNIKEVDYNNVQISKQASEYYGKELYIDAEDTEILKELTVNLGRFASRVQEACYKECERDLPEKDCSENLIIWKDSQENKVYEEQNCVFIDGNLKTVDIFLYRILGLN